MNENKSSIGSIIAAIIIIALIILGGLYFWGKRIEDMKLKQDLVSGTDTTMDEAAAIKSISDNDDLGSIEADLQATNLDNLSSELTAQ